MIQNIKLYDAYRGLLSIVVLIGHLCATFIYPYLGAQGVLPDLLNFSSTWAVNIFFLLSGYLITLSIFGNISRNSYFKWTNFLISRVARIYPPLIASIACSAILYWLVSHFHLHGSDSFRLPSDLFVIREKFLFSIGEVDDSILMRGGLLSINGALWSLYVEVKIYIVAMLTAILIRGRDGWLVKSLSFFALFYVGWQLRGSLVFVAIWGLGAAYYVMSIQKPVWLDRLMNILYLVALTISSFYLLTAPELFYQGNNTLKSFFVVLAFSLVVSGVIFTWALGAKYLYFFAPTAKYSYTLYIIHFPLLLFSFSLTHQVLSSDFNYAKLAAVSAIVFVVILGVAQLLASFFEDKNRFERYINNLITFMDPKRLWRETTCS